MKRFMNTTSAIALACMTAGSATAETTVDLFVDLMEDIETARGLGFLSNMTFMCSDWIAIKDPELLATERLFSENWEAISDRLELINAAAFEAYIEGDGWIVDAYTLTRTQFPEDRRYAKQLACQTAAELYMPGVFLIFE